MATVSLTTHERRILRTSIVAFVQERPAAAVPLKEIIGLVNEDGSIEVTQPQAQKLILLLVAESDLDSLITLVTALRSATESLRTKLLAV